MLKFLGRCILGCFLILGAIVVAIQPVILVLVGMIAVPYFVGSLFANRKKCVSEAKKALIDPDDVDESNGKSVPVAKLFGAVIGFGAGVIRFSVRKLIVPVCNTVVDAYEAKNRVNAAENASTASDSHFTVAEKTDQECEEEQKLKDSLKKTTDETVQKTQDNIDGGTCDG